MRFDLGCGSHCRGDVGVTLATNIATCDSLSGLDVWLEPLGWRFNPHAQIVYMDVEEWVKVNRDKVGGNDFLMCHVLEHLKHPYETLCGLVGCRTFVVVVPNARLSDADWEDVSHLFSWTKPSLRHLLGNIFEDKKVSVGLINGGLDMVGIVD